MKIPLWIIPALSLALSLSAGAAPKIAVIRVKDIYTAQPGVKAAETAATQAKEKMLLDPRAEELRSAIDALRAIQSSINNPNKQLSNDEARRAAKEFEIKRLETKSLQEDFEKFRAQREREINARLVNDIRIILNRIVELSKQTATEKGYDLVLDSSGFTNSSIPFVLYVKNAPDLTDEVMAAMKEMNTNTPPASTTGASGSDDAEPSSGSEPTQP